MPRFTATSGASVLLTDKVTLEAPEMFTTGLTAATRGSVGTSSALWQSWRLADGASQACAGSKRIRTGWATTDIWLGIGNPDAATVDNVRLRLDYASAASGDLMNAVTTLLVTTAMPAQYGYKEVQIGAGIALDPAKNHYFKVVRLGTDGADPYTGNVDLLRVILGKAS